MGIYTGYFDESNDEHSSPHLVMGGLVLDAERIGDFDQEWVNAIRELPTKDGSPFLHTTDFMSGNDIYDPVWKGRYPEKLAVLTAAAKVINKYSVQVFSGVVDVDEYLEFDEITKFSEAVGFPYALGVRLSYEQMVKWSYYCASAVPIRMVVEARHGYGEVSAVFMRESLPVPLPEAKSACALQAADYIAWMRSKVLSPNRYYLEVRDSWREISKFLYTDQHFRLEEYAQIWWGLCTVFKLALPFRDEEDSRIVFDGNFNNPRRRFLRRRKDKPKTI
jgi:hypothetical protein